MRTGPFREWFFFGRFHCIVYPVSIQNNVKTIVISDSYFGQKWWATTHHTQHIHHATNENCSLSSMKNDFFSFFCISSFSPSLIFLFGKTTTTPSPYNICKGKIIIECVYFGNEQMTKMWNWWENRINEWTKKIK